MFFFYRNSRILNYVWNLPTIFGEIPEKSWLLNTLKNHPPQPKKHDGESLLCRMPWRSELAELRCVQESGHIPRRVAYSRRTGETTQWFKGCFHWWFFRRDNLWLFFHQRFNWLSQLIWWMFFVGGETSKIFRYRIKTRFRFTRRRWYFNWVVSSTTN